MSCPTSSFLRFSSFAGASLLGSLACGGLDERDVRAVPQSALVDDVVGETEPMSILPPKGETGEGSDGGANAPDPIDSDPIDSKTQAAAGSESADEASEPPSNPLLSPPPLFEPDPNDSIAQLVWDVGGEGTGPGLFDDARFVAADGQGNLFVAEFETDGPTRVQIFDPDGNFVDQWFTAGEAIVTDMDSTRSGVLYILQGGTIERYTGLTGESLGPQLLPSGSADAIAIGPDEGLVAVNRDEIVKFDAQGQVVFAGADSINEVLDGSIFINDAAVDGAGNIYVVDTFEAGIFQFNSAGTFVNRIGVEGDGPGLLGGGSDAITVDGRGRIYFPEFDGVEIFESDGGHFGQLTSSGFSFGVVVTLQNELVGIDRNEARLKKYQLVP